jgi:hypothetical protein
MAETRQQLASLAHAKAHEVTALREALQLIAGGQDPQTVLRSMIDARMTQVRLMGNEVAGHA